MCRLPLYHVDAFADRLFAGNPAAVVPLPAWRDDATLLAIAAENNLSETAFLIPEAEGFALRWFTPAVEVDLCGHATLAAAWVVFHHLRPEWQSVRFTTASGPLTVHRVGDALRMDFPARPPRPAPVPPGLSEALGTAPAEMFEADGENVLVVLETPAALRALRPDVRALAAGLGHGVIVTAPAGPTDGADFLSRYFAPAYGIDEDPVTGSAHCTLAPYWAARLGHPEVTGFQASARGGWVACRLDGDRVHLTGTVIPYLIGEITP
ncbi:PhzF family phenazine biosynthesis protein [Roseospira marina]|uniref:PhzF family phenazine biosynthesis protein n=1 Tax=Roseospira marina TaxID=140057 RepID=A0A5M6I6W7_9PROT|nr:PhzF family phenazine biosynthesis protein [Roseospira marina]KAA5603863.1 PhzF family phenazine biosynthesis protein [Roseospira marina]MBB4313727.1 PhzF family phenazine biosynthesis protein [Roseospira marina]MBB5086889.1 PhzF family phenazine biosynthesis protein [Roseospira marina]